jgi:hypothetical protein
MNITAPKSRRKFLGQLSTGLGSMSVMDLNRKSRSGANRKKQANKAFWKPPTYPQKPSALFTCFNLEDPLNLIFTITNLI